MNVKLQAKARIPTRSGSPVISNNLFQHRVIRQIEAGKTHHRLQLGDSNFNHDFSRVPISVNSQAKAIAEVSPRVPGPIQAKLVVNEPGDEYEREADRVADAVMRINDPKAVSSGVLSMQGKCTTCEKEELRRKNGPSITQPPSPFPTGFERDRDSLRSILEDFTRQLNRAAPDEDMVKILRDVIHVHVERMILNRDEYMRGGHTREELEYEIKNLPWPPQIHDQRDWLINAVRS